MTKRLGINSRVVFICAMMFIFYGCAHYVPVSMNPTPLANSSEPPHILGYSQNTYVLGFPMGGNESLDAALNDAQKRAEGNKFTVSYVDKKETCIPTTLLPLLCRTETDIYGYAR